MKRVIAIQHTQSIHHVNGMVGSWTDWELSELGVRQAEAIGETLTAEIGGTPWALYASDLMRARRTAEIVGARLGVQPLITPALREQNLGPAVGNSVQWLKDNLEREAVTVDDRLFTGAESTREMWNRLEPFYREVVLGPQQDTLIVSHSTLLSAFFAMWLNLPVEALNGCSFRGLPGGVSFLEEGRHGRHAIRRLSDMSYLR
jgi:probable phosphoglycerate mutase